MTDTANADQIAYWNGAGGRHWTERQTSQDTLLSPIAEIILREAAPAPGETAIDVGCGCGVTTRSIARLVGPGGYALGVDVSTPMLARARELAAGLDAISFVEADATTYDFTPAKAELLFSRFGVMFFANPRKSFANLRLAARSTGRLVFACWREPRLNGWLMEPLKAVYEHVPRLPQTAPDDPGPFSFASEERVRAILNDAGFTFVEMKAFDLDLDIAAGAGFDTAVRNALELGPASRALEGHADATRNAAVASMRRRLQRFRVAEEVRLPASIWIVHAQPGG